MNAFFATGALSELTGTQRTRLLSREPADAPDTRDAVAAILAEVKSKGDEALLGMASRFDGVSMETLEVPPGRWKTALDGLSPEVGDALRRAASNIQAFHEAQIPTDITVETEPGVTVTRRWVPLSSVGVYAPGGLAAYPSSVLMGVVPARAAGVQNVIVCSPPGPNGLPPEEVMAACAIGGATRLFAIGGAGAVAALAFGTQTVPTVDAIVGPGNRWVTEAKRQVAGRVLIDSPAGPSEVLVVADESADATLVALEMLAQAEHDPEAACVLVSTSKSVATDTREKLERLLAEAPRRSVATAALEANGAILTAPSLSEALSFAQEYAAEHLSVMTTDAAADAERVTTAGTTFVGKWASVAFGDYLTGANHVLPTAGRARSFSGLSAQHFLRSYTVQQITEAGAHALAGDTAILAAAEGLPAHGAAATARRDG
jgi:histidinol dehydrogenase